MVSRTIGSVDVTQPVNANILHYPAICGIMVNVYCDSR